MSKTSDDEVDSIACTIGKVALSEIPEDPISETLDDLKNVFSTGLKAQGDSQTFSNAPQGQVLPEAISPLGKELLPYQKLSAEILSKIFRYCLDGAPVKFPHKSPEEMPWVLCRVCSRWRSVVLADQQIWANVRINSLKKDSQAQVAVRELLSRSGGSGLKLRMDLDPNIFDIAVEHFARIESLSLVSIPPFHRDSLAKIGSFTKLQSLELYHHNSDHDSPTSASAIIPETETSTSISLPATVQKFSLSGSYSRAIPFNTLGFSLESPAWASVTHLTVLRPFGINSLDMLVILSQCNELLECEISLEASLSANVVHPQQITIPKLQSLTLSSGPSLALGQFLDSLILPSLVEMSIKDESELEWPHDALLRMVTRSQCRLKSFESSRNYVSLDEAISLMRALPHLITLFLYVDPPLSDEQFNTIIEEGLLPRLEELYINVDPSAEILYFLDLMRFRQPNRMSRGALFVYGSYLTDEEREMVKELEWGLSARKMDLGVDFI